MDNLQNICKALARGPSPTEKDIGELVAWARGARSKIAELEAEVSATEDVAEHQRERAKTAERRLADLETEKLNRASLLREALSRTAEYERELLSCKKLAIATLCDEEKGHDGPGGALERVMALAKECCELTSHNGELGYHYTHLAEAVERLLPQCKGADTNEVNACLDAHWREPEKTEG